MKVYGDLISSSTRRVLATAAHIGVPVELETVDLIKGENRRSAFLALNPNGAIPAFSDGVIRLYEASAIMIYLAEKYGSDLLPAGNDRYETLKWTLWAAEHFRLGPNILLEERYLKKLHGRREDPRHIAYGERLTRQYTAVLDQHLKSRHFVAADHVTLADFDIAAPFSHLARSHAPFAEFGHVMSWHQRLLSEVPAWKASGDRLEERINEIAAHHHGELVSGDAG
jgi:glutathione S-transferase